MAGNQDQRQKSQISNLARTRKLDPRNELTTKSATRRASGSPISGVLLPLQRSLPAPRRAARHRRRAAPPVKSIAVVIDACQIAVEDAR